ncbi:MAG TPA: FecR domain-containing protein [Thermoanaerobaculia bacterium]|nr:FecR domain-containing protein [Thermoanaerobaculia bacterium]
MTSRMTSRLSASCLALLLSATAPALAADVGEVVLVRNDVRGTSQGGSPKPLAVGNGVSLGLRVDTGADSGARMTFDPSGSLTLGSRARAVIDRNLVDQVTGRSDSALSVLAGQVRLALGKLFRGEVSIDTPTAVVGVKGTDLRVDVDEPTGTTVVTVTEGVVTVRSKSGGEVTVRAGQRTLVASGQPPTPPALVDPSSTALSASAGGPAFTTPQETVFPDAPLLGPGRDQGFPGIGGVGVRLPGARPNG